MDEGKNVFLLVGSVSKNSHTRALVKAASDTLKRHGGTAVTWDLLRQPLPICNPAFHHSPDQYPDLAVQKFYLQVRQANAIVLASPLYHGSYSGVLKNALDLLWYDAFRNKIVALLSHGSSESNASSPCVDLQSVVRTLYGICAQTQVCTGKRDYALTEGVPELANPEIQSRLERLAEEVAWLAPMISLRAQR